MTKRKLTQGTRKEILVFLIVFIIFVFALPFVLADNDPGHDTLYIESQGDSELNGSLNITNNLTVEGGRTALINYLDIYFNGVTVASPSVPTIAGTANDLYLDAKAGGNVLINSLANSGTVFLGSTGDTVNLNVTGALYFVNDRLGVSTGSTAASGDLYWGDKLVCDASESNCGWATGVAAGDITSVQSDNTYIYNGSDTGAVYLLFNETKLNATIQARATALGGDGNNYTTAIVVTGTTTKNITLVRNSAENISVTFTDADADTWATEGTSVKANITNVNATANSKASPGTCTGNQVVQNTTTGGVQCITPAAGGNITGAGTSETLAKFTGDGTIGNSIITESGNVITIAGNISMPDNFYIGGGAAANGTMAIAIGYGALAIGGWSVAVGQGANASYQGGTAVGQGTVITDTFGTALGEQAQAGYVSTAIGNGALALGGYATAVGYASNTSGYQGAALGYNAGAHGQYSVAVGSETNATADYAMAIGKSSLATAQYSTAIGYGVVNDITNSTKLGGMVILSGTLNATSHNVSSVSCIVFDSGGKICTGG